MAESERSRHLWGPDERPPTAVWMRLVSSEAGPESSTTRHVILAIGLYMNGRGEGAFPSVRTIAADVGLHHHTVHQHVKRAATEGWLEIAKSSGAGQAWRRNTYASAAPEAVRTGRTPLPDVLAHRIEELLAEGVHREPKRVHPRLSKVSIQHGRKQLSKKEQKHSRGKVSAQDGQPVNGHGGIPHPKAGDRGEGFVYG